VAKSVACGMSEVVTISRGASEGVGPAGRYRLFQRLETGGLQSRNALPMVCLRWWGQPSKVAQRSMWSMVGFDRQNQLPWRV